jgi:hypothetical protein
MSFLQEYSRVPIEKVRAEVIEQLKLNFAHNNIGVDEFERRLTQATGAESKDILFASVQGLPVIDEDVRAAEPEEAPPAGVRINRGAVRDSAFYVGIMSETSRKNRWAPARSIKTLSVMGSVVLDLTDAEFPKEGVTISGMALMGSLEVYVPEGVRVNIAGIPLMGSVEDKSSGGVSHPGAPEVRIRGLALMGSIEVKNRKKK